ncbi:efflux transporter outer membrane subunit [Rubrolithibacter danxiaensis]|uniref:efflux transporter outer membrane subunit n=1 Tax=Rubrolithibacter danxiaensis TaxID=3390805 RepID=UPI003BF909A2
MNNRYIKHLLIAGVIVLSFASCKVTQKYKSAGLSTDGLYRDINSSDTSTMADIPLKEFFTDPELLKLLDEGISQNLDLKIAITRIQQSEAYLRQSKAALFPSLNANASATVSKLSDGQGGRLINNTRVYQLGLTSSWEADIWGKLSSSKRANLAALLESRAYARAVQTRLVANIANTYYQLLALDQQLAITQQSVQNWISTVETMKALKEGAIVTGAAVVQTEASRYAAEVTIPDIKQNIRETENALSILLGRNPGPVVRSSLEQQKQITAVSPGIPAQLLSNRPDVQQAELNFRYYFESTNVARSYFYPALTITASGGLSNTTLQDFFSAGSVFGNLVGGLTQPIFNQRANRTRYEVAKAAQQEALLSFKSTLLTAGQEVSDALSSYQTAIDKQSSRSSQISALEKSVAYSQDLLKSGFANYTEVLNAQQSLLSAQLNRVNDQLQEFQSTVELYRALGGGWR